MTNQPTVNDFFCGAGGMGLGFKQAGFEIKGAWDFDKYAIQTYKHNVGEHALKADIMEMTFKDVPESDVWTFGFPCQDLSNAGNQAGLFEGKRSRLFFEVMRLIDEMKENNSEALPKILLAENVRGLKKYLPVLKEEYNKRGYRMAYALCNSKYWGVPQSRERYFVVGIREDFKKAFTFPKQQTEFVPKLSTILEDLVDEKFYLSDEQIARFTKSLEDFEPMMGDIQVIGTTAPPNFNGNGSIVKDKSTSAWVHGTEKRIGTLSARDYKQPKQILVKQATKKGYDIAVEGDSINISHPNSKTRRGRVGKQIAQTLLTGLEQVVVEGDDIRKMTPREYARAQGFPDDFEIVVSNSQFYKQMGNAVTVNVAKAIAEQIKNYLSK